MAKKRTGLLPGLLLVREANGEASGSGQRAMQPLRMPCQEASEGVPAL